MMFVAGFYKGLKRRLSIEFDCQINDITTFHQTKWWGICPSSCQVNTHRTASPYYLIRIDRHTGGLFLLKNGRRETVPQKFKAFLLIFLILFTIEPFNLRPKQIIVNTLHERC